MRASVPTNCIIADVDLIPSRAIGALSTATRAVLKNLQVYLAGPDQIENVRGRSREVFDARAGYVLCLGSSIVEAGCIVFLDEHYIMNVSSERALTTIQSTFRRWFQATEINWVVKVLIDYRVSTISYFV